MRLRKILLGAFLGVEASSSGCPDPIIWYRLRFDSAVNFVGCSENKASKKYDNNSKCQVHCPPGMKSTVDQVICECTEINNHYVSCKWSPNKKIQTVKCYGKPKKRLTSSSSSYKGRQVDGLEYFRPRPRGISYLAKFRMTSDDIVYTKATYREFASRGILLPSKNIIKIEENSQSSRRKQIENSRALLVENKFPMGQRWIFYGKNGTSDKNGYKHSTSKYVVPVYFDNRHSISRANKNTVIGHFAWINKEFNNCIQIDPISRLAAQRLEHKIHIVDGGGCWSFLGAQQAEATGQRLSLDDTCYTRGVTLHEIFHALGRDHEQNRPDRNEYVKIHWDRITDGKAKNFKLLVEEAWLDTNDQYELNSVMHYGSWDFSRDPKNYNYPTITDRKTDLPIQTQRLRPTTLDIIQTCKQYHCEENCGHELVTCPISGERIFKHRICDGEFDCSDKSDEENCDFSCCKSFFLENDFYSFYSKFNGKDAYKSNSGLYLYYMTNHWYISRILGSHQLISYAISSEICPENIPGFMEYDYDLEIYISGDKSPICVEEEVTTSIQTSSTPETTTVSLTSLSTETPLFSIEGNNGDCSNKPKINNGFWECDDQGQRCSGKCNPGYALSCDELSLKCALDQAGSSWDQVGYDAGCKCLPELCNVNQLPQKAQKPAYHWHCDKMASAYQVPTGATCRAVCENREDTELIAICIGQISSSTCLADGSWSNRPNCHCSKNTCGEPKLFSLKERRLGGELIYSQETTRFGLNSIVTASCPDDAILHCTKGNSAKCTLNKIGTMDWDTDSECECIKYCPNPSESIRLAKDIIPINCDDISNDNSCNLQCSQPGHVIHTSNYGTLSYSIKLKCYCTRQQCRWKEPLRNKPLTGAYCADEGACPNPGDFFYTYNASNIEMECIDRYGRPIIYEEEKVKWGESTYFDQSYQGRIAFLRSRGPNYEHGSFCRWKCKATNQRIRPKLITSGVSCSCKNGKCQWQIRNRDINALNPHCS